MKVNIWEKDKGSTTLDSEYLYENYRPAKSSANYSGFYNKNKKENRWVFQLLVSGAVLLALFGLFNTNIPFGGALKNGVRYLMTAETDVQPVLHKIVQISAQTGNLEWPLVDDIPQASKAAILEVPASAVLQLPVSGKLVRTYGWIVDPGEQVQKFHEGVDLAVPVGTSVKAAADGQVINTGEMQGFDKYVLVRNKSGEMARYANLSEIKVQDGQVVKAGEVLAESGMEEGNQPHVHFEVIVDSRPVDPLGKLGIDFTRLSADGKTAVK